MIKFNRFLLILLFNFCLIKTSEAMYHTTVSVGGYEINLSKEAKGTLEVRKGMSGQSIFCNIKNWSKPPSTGTGIISLTSDDTGLLIYPGNQYIKIKELLACNYGSVKLYDIPYPEDLPGVVIDVNFNKKILMSLIVTDAQASLYQTVVSYFNGNKNIFSGKGFWDEFSDEEGDSFYVDLDDFYIGKISSNGEYISPSFLDCSPSSFPGVWNIKSRKKVVFQDKADSIIENKCKKLFTGEATLKELKGQLLDQ
ncbi:hypothetical protein [Intestinirhabdus alba]|jgi:hypothetical protein|uniref:Uncharacterized protein n=1 Tax=Intestinirhabdus alba TaxID=2899544 RepID=A0A6L6INU6_9ENTR|nr:hypothetical protein [Intestinirhabdus alba]MTH48542.1 hypothetical protein [Intestinirhabdus alba]